MRRPREHAERAPADLRDGDAPARRFYPHHPLLLAHGRDLLARGCDGLAVFGTSGEGPCLPVAARRAGLELLLESGIGPDRLVVGAASTSPADVIELTRHALAVGVPRVLLMPPFFLREAASEEGLFRFYAAVIEAADPGLRLLLYHFPAITGVRLSVELIGRLRDAFGDVILGIKDSGGDFSNTAAYLEAFPALTIYAGTEVHARRAMALGGVGTICGLGNLLPQAIRRYPRCSRGRGGALAGPDQGGRRCDLRRAVPAGLQGGDRPGDGRGRLAPRRAAALAARRGWLRAAEGGLGRDRRAPPDAGGLAPITPSCVPQPGRAIARIACRITPLRLESTSTTL